MCGFQTHQVSQATQAPIPAPNTVRGPTIACMELISSYSLNRGNNSWFIIGRIMAKTTPKWITTVPKRISKLNSQQKTTICPGQQSKRKRLTQTALGKKIYTLNLCLSETCTWPQNTEGKHARFHSVEKHEWQSISGPPCGCMRSNKKDAYALKMSRVLSLREDEQTMESHEWGVREHLLLSAISWREWKASWVPLLLPNMRFLMLVECASG